VINKINILLVIVLALSACKHDIPQPASNGGGTVASTCDPDSVYFTKQVLPLLVSNCTMANGCHDAASAADGIVLTSYQTVMSSDVVNPGNAGNSDLIEAITDNNPDDVMPPPPSSPLTSAQIALITTWINQGALNNDCIGCDDTQFTWSGTIKPLLDTKCIGCHGSTSVDGSLATHAAVVGFVSTGQLMGSIMHDPNYAAMPKNGAKLSDCEIEACRKWVEAGYPEN
jgi:mono/diheme cytochrome c family protein